ncbi:MAG TPA: hypothetical protein VIQ74_12150, partial [Gemmatimonadaceae bacterium]
EELALHVRTLARQLFADERAACPVAFAGGLLRSGSSLRKRLEHRLKSSTPGAQISSGEVCPERGAMRAALALAGGPEEVSNVSPQDDAPRPSDPTESGSEGAPPEPGEEAGTGEPEHEHANG